MFKLKSLWPIRVFTMDIIHLLLNRLTFSMCQQKHVLHYQCASCSVWFHCFLFRCGNVDNTKALKPHVHNTQGFEHHFCTNNTTQWLGSAPGCIYPQVICFILCVTKRYLCFENTVIFFVCHYLIRSIFVKVFIHVEFGLFKLVYSHC